MVERVELGGGRGLGQGVGSELEGERLGSPWLCKGWSLEKDLGKGVGPGLERVEENGVLGNECGRACGAGPGLEGVGLRFPVQEGAEPGEGGVLGKRWGLGLGWSPGWRGRG